jgi:hypothetical protein
VFAFLKDRRLRRKYGAPIIVVSGLPRSGTSMMMKMLDAGGLDLVTDNVRTADEDNPKGYFEYERVKDLDKTDDKSWLAGYRGKVVKIISFLLRDLPDDFHYKIIFMRRDLEEVIASQNKMLIRRGEPTDEANDAKMIKNYKMHLVKTDFLLEEKPNLDALLIDYRGAIEDPRSQATAVARFLGMKLDVDRMAEAVDPRLYRNRSQAEAAR